MPRGGLSGSPGRWTIYAPTKQESAHANQHEYFGISRQPEPMLQTDWHAGETIFPSLQGLQHNPDTEQSITSPCAERLPGHRQCKCKTAQAAGQPMQLELKPHSSCQAGTGCMPTAT